MSQKPREKKPSTTTGAYTACILLLVMTAVLWSIEISHINQIIDQGQRAAKKAKTLSEENKNMGEKVAFLEKNQQTIRTQWIKLSQSIHLNSLNKNETYMFEAIGINNITPNRQNIIPGLVRYNLQTDRAEWQRICSALIEFEQNYALLQYDSVNLSLPPDTLPFASRPTYLELSVQFNLPTYIP